MGLLGLVWLHPDKLYMLENPMTLPKRSPMLRSIIRYFSPLFLTLLITVPALAAPLKVAILPFQINAEKDYTFLQKGIVDMLASRLALPGKTEIVDPLTTSQALESAKGFTGDNLALMVAAKLQADRVLHGSITLLGESVSIDAKMLDATGNQPPYTFFNQTQGMNEVIGQINLLANEINAQVFNRIGGAAAAPGTPTTQTRRRITASSACTPKS
jgi:TolB-like protein